MPPGTKLLLFALVGMCESAHVGHRHARCQSGINSTLKLDDAHVRVYIPSSSYTDAPLGKIEAESVVASYVTCMDSILCARKEGQAFTSRVTEETSSCREFFPLRTFDSRRG